MISVRESALKKFPWILVLRCAPLRMTMAKIGRLGVAAIYFQAAERVWSIASDNSTNPADARFFVSQVG